MRVDLTRSQLMALQDPIVEHLQCPRHTEVYVDVVRNGETRPEELMPLLMDAQLDVAQLRHEVLVNQAGHDCEEWLRDGRCRLCDRRAAPDD